MAHTELAGEGGDIRLNLPRMQRVGHELYQGTVFAAGVELVHAEPVRGVLLTLLAFALVVGPVRVHAFDCGPDAIRDRLALRNGLVVAPGCEGVDQNVVDTLELFCRGIWAQLLDGGVDRGQVPDIEHAGVLLKVA